jgi:hypothetical protein
MKKLLIFATLATLTLTSCSSFQPAVFNITQSETQVVINQANFVVRDRVEGSVTARYFFGLGGIFTKSLAGEATNRMYVAAQLKGSQVIVDKHIEFKRSSIIPGVYGSIKATATGTVIEFQK